VGEVWCSYLCDHQSDRIASVSIWTALRSPHVTWWPLIRADNEWTCKNVVSIWNQQLSWFISSQNNSARMSYATNSCMKCIGRVIKHNIRIPAYNTWNKSGRTGRKRPFKLQNVILYSFHNISEEISPSYLLHLQVYSKSINYNGECKYAWKIIVCWKSALVHSGYR
jgi:hypothetical protein